MEFNFLITVMWKGNLASIFLSHPVFVIVKLMVILVHCDGVDFSFETEVEELFLSIKQCCLVNPHLLVPENMMDCTEMNPSCF